MRFLFCALVLSVSGCAGDDGESNGASSGLTDAGSAGNTAGSSVSGTATDGGSGSQSGGTTTSGSSSAGTSGASTNGGSESSGTAGTATTGLPTTGNTSAGNSDGYYVEGNQIFDKDGIVHRFHGVDRPSLEWNPAGEDISQADFQLIAGWDANVVRIALNQGYWLEGSVAYNSEYRATIDAAISWAETAGLDVLLDLHWSDRGDLGTWPGQQRMADANSKAFWLDVADRYKDNPAVLFELYNEPHEVSWEVWLNGGDSGDGFTVVGMQELYDTVRGAGAENLVLVGGLNYAYDLSGVPDNRVEGYNIVYASHPYDYAEKQPSAWEADWGFLAATDPLFITEFGSFDCNASYTQQLIDFADAKGASWSAWAWYPGGCGFPALIEDWSGTPTASGQIVKSALAAY